MGLKKINFKNVESIELNHKTEKNYFCFHGKHRNES